MGLLDPRLRMLDRVLLPLVFKVTFKYPPNTSKVIHKVSRRRTTFEDPCLCPASLLLGEKQRSQKERREKNNTFDSGQYVGLAAGHCMHSTRTNSIVCKMRHDIAIRAYLSVPQIDHLYCGCCADMSCSICCPQ